jgi:iron(III) transport system ATP-binding protein
VATFLGDAVLLPAVVQGNVAICALGELALRAPVAEGPAQVLIRPEQVTLVDPTTPDAIAALVVERTYFGKDALLRLVLEPSGTTVSARVSGFSPALASQQVSIAVHEPVIAYPQG